jgi:hypothetical protein
MAGTLIGFGYAGLHDSTVLSQLVGDALDLVVDVRDQALEWDPAIQHRHCRHG